jgi:hypothetical protein
VRQHPAESIRICVVMKDPFLTRIH